jgi:hypothetical protein
MKPDGFRDEDHTHDRIMSIFDLFIVLLRDDDSYIGILYLYLEHLVQTPNLHMI